MWGLPPWLISKEPVQDSEALPSGWETFPLTPYFRPLFADPREPRTEISLLYFDLPPGDPTGGDRLSGLAFVGDNFTLVRRTWGRTRTGYNDGWEIGLQGMIAGESAFIDNTPPGQRGLGGALINADFIFGPTFALLYGRFSVRARYYHQSTHLGDELLINRPSFQTEANRAAPPFNSRLNFSYEAVESIVAYTGENWRFYGGGAFKVHIEPGNIKRGELHFGVECRTDWRIFYIGRLVLGYDLKIFEYHEWAPEHSGQIGLELGQLQPEKRNFKLLFEYFNGHNPNGQFFLDTRRMQYYGLGLRFAL